MRRWLCGFSQRLDTVHGSPSPLTLEEDDRGVDPADGSEVNRALSSLEHLESIVVDLDLASVDAAAAAGDGCNVRCLLRCTHVGGCSK